MLEIDLFIALGTGQKIGLRVATGTYRRGFETEKVAPCRAYLHIAGGEQNQGAAFHFETKKIFCLKCK